MKRKTLAFVVVLIILFHCCAAVVAETNVQGFTAGQYQAMQMDPPAITAIAQDGDTFYALTTAPEIMAWNRETGGLSQFYTLPGTALPDTFALYAQLSDAQKAAVDENCLTNIFCGDGRLWGMNLFSGRVCRIDENAVTWLEYAFDNEDMLENCAEMNLSDYDVKGFVEDSVLYFWFNLYSGSVAVFNLQNGAQTEYRLDMTIHNFVAYKHNQALLSLINAAPDSGKSLYTLQLDTGAVEALPIEEARFLEDKQEIVVGINGLAYDSTTDSIYYIASNTESAENRTLCRSVEGAPFEKRSALTSNKRISRGFASGGSWYMLWDSDDVLYAYNDGAADTKAVINIKGLFPYGYLQKFMQENPGIVVQNQVDNIYDEDIALLLSNSNTIDIYAIHANQLFQSIKTKNYAVDLSASPEIAEAVDSLYPKILDVIADGERIYGYPSFFDFYLWRVDTQIWNDVFGTLAYPQTFSEFFDLMCAWEDERGDEYGDVNMYGITPLNILLLEMIYQYITNCETPDEPLIFDSSVFSDTLDSFVHMLDTIDRDVFEKNYNAGNACLFSSWPVNAQNDTRIFLDSDGSSQEQLIDPFSFEADQPSRIRGDMIVLFVNPNSIHQEEALALIAFVTREENTSATLYYALHDNCEVPFENPVYQAKASALEEQEEQLLSQWQAVEDLYKSDIEVQLDGIAANMAKNEQSRWLITADSLMRYQSWMERIRFSASTAYISEDDVRNAFYVQGKQLCTLLCAGALSTDQFIDKLDALVKKIYLENQ